MSVSGRMIWRTPIIDGNQRYSWTKNRRSLFVGRALPRHVRPSSISCWRRTAFSASSRAVDLNGETGRAKANHRSPITRSAYAIRPSSMEWPSRSIPHAWRKIVAPSPVMASLDWIPSRTACAFGGAPGASCALPAAQGAASCAVHLHDVVGDQDRLCLAVARSPAPRNPHRVCRCASRWPRRRARRYRPAAPRPHRGCGVNAFE